MPITLTDSAAARINSLTRTGEQAAEYAGQILRLTVDAGGCSGFEYKYAFAPAPAAGDSVFEHAGARLAIDAASLELLDGATLDYKSDLMGAHFQIVNPNAVAGCGCGNSFAV